MWLHLHLAEPSYLQVYFSLPFALLALQDSVLHQSNDWFASTTKLKCTGFNGMKVDSEDMSARQLQQLSDKKIIPSYSKGGSPSAGHARQAAGDVAQAGSQYAAQAKDKANEGELEMCSCQHSCKFAHVAKHLYSCE